MPSYDRTNQNYSTREAERARREEEQRQDKIDTGIAGLNAIFNGGRYVRGQRRVYDEGFTPLEVTRNGSPDAQPGDAGFVPLGRPDENPQAFRPSGAFNGGRPETFTAGNRTFGDRADANRYRLDVNRNNSDVETVRSRRFQGINALLSARRSAMLGQALPALYTERENQQEALNLALARSGLAKSSVADRRRAQLETDYQTAKAKIGTDVSNDLANTRSGLLDQKDAIASTITATGDASAGINSALNRISNVASAAPTVNPIGDALTGAAQGIGAVRTGYDYGVNSRRLEEIRKLNPSAGYEVK